MHPNPAFLGEGRDRNLALSRGRGGLASPCGNGAGGPLAAHVPFLLSDEAGAAGLHLARSDPVVRAGLPASAVMIVSGPDACVSPDWSGAWDQVPPWNHGAVHLAGGDAGARAIADLMRGWGRCGDPRAWPS
jgi:transcriptional regulator